MPNSPPTKPPPVRIEAKRARRKIVHDLCTKIKSCQDRNPLKSGAETMISNSSLVYPWLTRNMVYGYLKRIRKKDKAFIDSAINKEKSPTSSTATSDKLVGRPIGLTHKIIHEEINKKAKARDNIAILYAKERVINGGVLPRHKYKQIHDTVIAELEITDKNFNIKSETIRSRVKRKALEVTPSQNQDLPVAEIEPVLLQLAVWKQQAGQPITQLEGLEFANSLIDGKPLQAKLKTWQASRRMKNLTGLLSYKYWIQFLKRHGKVLDSARGHRVAANRTEWVTYVNVDCMYNLVYEQMINAGIARRLSESEEYWIDENGEKVSSEDNAVGMKVKIEITHPEWLLFGDEVGTNISQQDDGHVGGTKFVVEKGSRANQKSSHTDGRFTAIGITAASGEPVMAIIIFSAMELNFVQRMGHDVRATYDETKSVSENSGPEKAFPGAPVCIFRGKDVPAIVTCTKKGGITSGILRAAFKRMDDIGLYDRTEGRTPMALFDAHDSRLQVEFLQYVNNPAHLWKFCIGLPNGTHKWQVGDSKEQNGSYKVEFAREKAKLVLWKTRNGMKSEIEKSDAIPLFNICWHKSFAKIHSNQRAIRDRGWNPANRRLLTDPEIIKTKPKCNSNITATDEIPPSATTIMTPSQVSVSTASGFASVSQSTIATDVFPSPWIDLNNLNFEQGLAGEFTIDIIQHMVRNEKVTENLKKRYKNGQIQRRKIDETRRLTGGTLFEANHILLDSEVLNLRESKEKQKKNEKERIIYKLILDYRKREKAYIDLKSSNSTESDYKGDQYKVIINHTKQTGDKAVPTRVADLKVRYDKVKSRTPYTLKKCLEEKGYCKNPDDLVLCLRLISEETATQPSISPSILHDVRLDTSLEPDSGLVEAHSTNGVIHGVIDDVGGEAEEV